MTTVTGTTTATAMHRPRKSPRPSPTSSSPSTGTGKRNATQSHLFVLSSLIAFLKTVQDFTKGKS